MLAQKQALTRNRLAVSLQKAVFFDQYIQIMALWTDDTLDNESGWTRLCAMRENLLADEALKNGSASLCVTCPPQKAGTSLFLSLEDARVLNHRIERVDALFQMGIRFLTPLWWGDSCIGGAHDTQVGLTDFGKRAMRAACERGMILDISHASRASANDIFEIAELQSRPVIASHSNAYRVCPVSRNLHPDQIQAIQSSGGVIGLNLYTHFLSNTHDATREDVRRHIEYFLECGAESALCLGCDMDGAELPADIPDLEALPSLAQYLSNYYPETLIRAIFFENAYHFAKRHLLP